MTVDLFYFLPVIGLLWLSLPLSASKGKKSAYPGRTPNVPVRGLFLAWQNWVDLVRSGVGAYALMELSIGLEAASQQEITIAFVVKAAVLVVGVLIQTVRWTPGLNFVAPLFYLSGLTLVLPGYTEGAFAVIFAWIFTWGARDPKFHLPIMTTALAVAGYFLGGLSQVLLLNCGLVFLPAFFALLCQKGLLFVFRESKLANARSSTVPTSSSPGNSPPEEANLQVKSRSSAS